MEKKDFASSEDQKVAKHKSTPFNFMLLDSENPEIETAGIFESNSKTGKEVFTVKTTSELICSSISCFHRPTKI